MTWRSWLGRTIRELAAEPETRAVPPTSSPEPPPSFPTASGSTTPATSGGEPLEVQIVQMMMTMQRETLEAMRGMVMDILQGREVPPLSEADQVSASRTRFDPPDYDDPGITDLPDSIQGIFRREDREEAEFRTSQSEPELLRSQLERARSAAGMDPQGPSAAPSFSTESIGLRDEDLTF